MRKKKSMVSATRVKNNKAEILNDKINEGRKKKDKPRIATQQVRLHSDDDISMAKSYEPDRLMTIFSKTGNTQLRGPLEELRRFKEQIKNKDNRHTFLEVPRKLVDWNPALEEVTILPADVGVIIIADPTKAPRNPGILAPIPLVTKKLN